MDSALARATVDEATGLYNRSYLLRRIEADLAAARRWGRPLVCSIIFVDESSAPAAKPGEPAFDDLMHVASGAIVASLRKEDVVCRFGPKTFAALAFVAKGHTASEMAERTLAAVVSAGVHSCKEPANLTCCIGVAQSRFSFGGELLREAEKALWEARAAGKDRIRFAGEVTQLAMADAASTARPDQGCWLHN